MLGDGWKIMPNPLLMCTNSFIFLHEGSNTSCWQWEVLRYNVASSLFWDDNIFFPQWKLTAKQKVNRLCFRLLPRTVFAQKDWKLLQNRLSRMEIVLTKEKKWGNWCNHESIRDVNQQLVLHTLDRSPHKSFQPTFRWFPPVLCGTAQLLTPHNHSLCYLSICWHQPSLPSFIVQSMTNGIILPACPQFVPWNCRGCLCQTLSVISASR